MNNVITIKEAMENASFFTIKENESLKEYLENSIPFGIGRHRKTPKYVIQFVRYIYPMLNINKPKRSMHKKICILEELITDLIKVCKRGKCLAVSMRNGYYSKGNLGFSSSKLIAKMVNAFEDAGYIIVFNGYYDKITNSGRVTRIQAAEKLIYDLAGYQSNLFTTANICLDEFDVNSDLREDQFDESVSSSVVLRTKIRVPWESKPIINNIEYIDIPETIRMKAFLDEEYNRLLSKNRIDLSWNKIDRIYQPKQKLSMENAERDFFDGYSQIKEYMQRHADDPSMKRYRKYIRFEGDVRKSRELDEDEDNAEDTEEDYADDIIQLLGPFDDFVHYQRLYPSYYRVFSRGNIDFCFGGRFYCQEVQSLSKESRKSIRINEEDTVELDYSGHHIRLLYHLNNLDFNSDPYLLDGINEDTAKQLREHVKLMLLIMINCNSKEAAIFTFDHKINNKYWDKGKELKYLQMKEVMKKAKISAKKLHTLIQRKHNEIKIHFNNDEGVRLQNIDSKITEEVLKHFTDKGIVCLGIHDSYIVPKQYKEELTKVMIDSYRKYANGFYPIVKEN
jgi:hypothetical protein